ncbi:class I SAM-dependent methyltransferase [Actinomadura spongiicola]|uniref:Class I SAM-dependent methyltransferase n=1 Tax=Actinomadura spongiicola TaxID=2303421 RepID=A0A372GBV5_9ACTN|nr:class I SAM-dependent methyltransferase [Actinomadura spongiicola]RFS82841.1 class I SAM-dependent methyltransferase [Actinomadura spongiicola]
MITHGAAATGEPAPREETPGFDPAWLALREPADAAARDADLLEPLRAALPPAGPLTIWDLGCGTGSMGRWLSGRLRGPQHWVLYDTDPRLLDAARGDGWTSADGEPATVETRKGDIGSLRAADLVGASLVTASALLDVLTAAEVEAIAAAAACPALLTLSVVGRVRLIPSDPLDADLAAAFDAHQRRDGLLGPAAAGAAADAFARRGATVLTRPSPWRLGPGHGELITAWLRGWVAAAVEQRPDLAPAADAHLRRRLDACAAGGLAVEVHHVDLLAVPGGAR